MYYRELMKSVKYFKEAEEGDAAKMCDLLDKIENKGKLEANRETAKLFLINGASLELVEKSIPDLPKDEIQEIFNSIAKKES